MTLKPLSSASPIADASIHDRPLRATVRASGEAADVAEAAERSTNALADADGLL